MGMSTKEFFETYGVDIEMEERRDVQALKEQADRVLEEQLVAFSPYVDEVFTNVEAIAAGDGELRALAGRTAVYMMLSGASENPRWKESWSAGGAAYFRYTTYPMQSLFLSLAARCGVECDPDQVRWAVWWKKPLFREEGVLAAGEMGTFWRRLTQIMEGDGVWNLTVSFFLRPMLRALVNCRALFSGKTEEKALEAQARTMEDDLFSCWAYFPDRAAAEDAVRRWDFSRHKRARAELLIAAFPQQARRMRPGEVLEKDAGSLIQAAGAEDPETAVRMMELLLDTARDHLSDPAAAEELMGDVIIPCLDPALQGAVTEELRRNDRFARQLFQSAYADGLTEEVLNNCGRLGGEELHRHLTQLVLRSPYSTDLKRELEEWLDDEPPAPPEETRPPEKKLPKKKGPPEGPDAPEQPPDDGTLYRYCAVKVSGWRGELAYLAGDEPLQAGDMVTVPFGQRNEPRPGRVTAVAEYTRSQAPWPPEKTKTILGRIPPPEW